MSSSSSSGSDSSDDEPEPTTSIIQPLPLTPPPPVQIIPRTIEFQFPWDTSTTDLELDTSTIDDLRMQLSSSEFQAEEKCLVLLAQLETCESETTHKLDNMRHEQELATQEQNRLNEERSKLATKLNKLTTKHRTSERELKESEWRCLREKEERQLDQELSEKRIKESEDILNELKQQLKLLRERQSSTIKDIETNQNGKDTDTIDNDNTINTDTSGMDNSMTMTASSIDELESIQLSIETTNANVIVLQQTNKQLNTKIRTTERELDESNHQLKVMQTARTHQQEIHTTLSTEIEQCKTEINDLQYDLEEIREEKKTNDELTEQKRKELLHQTTLELKELKEILETTTVELNQTNMRLQQSSENEAVQLEKLMTVTNQESKQNRIVARLREELEHVKTNRTEIEEELELKIKKIDSLTNEAKNLKHSWKMKTREKIKLERTVEHTTKLNERRMEVTIGK